jgi:cobalt/nickel transport system permease protein
MHIPNGFLSPALCTATAVASAAGLALTALRISRRPALPAPQTPTVTVAAAAAAAIFVAQAVNFPIASGTSGHLLGAMLAVWLTGPAMAAAILSVVVTVQCLLLGDGGVHALGANVFNLALLAPLTAHVTFRWLQRRTVNSAGHLAALGLAAWVSVMVGAVAVAVELALSGTAPLTTVLPAMLLAHAPIGLGETLITVAVASLLSPRLSLNAARGEMATTARVGLVTSVLLFIAGLALVLAPFASALPDGLESVALKLGFASLESTSGFAPFAGLGLVAMLALGALTAAGVVAAVGRLARRAQ